MIVDNIDFVKRGEVRKKMAIDYEVEWEKLRESTGHCTVVKNNTGTTLNMIMADQIRNTIDEREKLMEEYIKEKILTTDITGGNKDYHDVNVIDKRYHTVICSRSISKAAFGNWLNNRKERR